MQFLLGNLYAVSCVELNVFFNSNVFATAAA